MTTLSQSLIIPAPRLGRLTRVITRFPPATLALIGIMVLAAALNFINISAIGQANTYYTAAIEAMLQSPSNFFFVAAEPGGSVSIDKPPLGLWIQAFSAFFLGVNGFAVVLPQILAGIFSVPLLYSLVKRYFGTGAGLIAALVMAVMPVSVAVQRNNTMDATLIFTLLLAAWAFVKATDTGKLRWLIAGGVLVGLGFNIKMLQAFLPVPAFYALYFLGSKVAWRRKFVHLFVTTVVLVAVSLSWVTIVDLTPTDQRPYVGSSTTNSALELALGYNGLQRLLGRSVTTSQTDVSASVEQPSADAPTDVGAQGTASGGMFVNEVGTASVLRLFSQPLNNETGWLLPFSLFSLGLVIVGRRPRLPLSDAHKAAILFGGWLLTEVVFFSAAGFFHAYYLAMLTPPLAALVGIGVMRLWQLHRAHKLLAIGMLVASVGASLAFQYTIAAGYTPNPTWIIIPAVMLVTGAGILLAARFISRFSRLAAVGFLCAVIALTAVPTVWAAMGTMQTTVNNAQPSTYGGTTVQVDGQMGGRPAGMRDGSPTGISSTGTDGTNTTDDGMRDGSMGGSMGSSSVDQNLIDYLQANTDGMRYMMAVNSSNQGAGYVLATGRGVLYLGGFSGSDSVVDASDLQALVDAGELRYVLSGGGMGGQGGGMDTKTEINQWLTESCKAVTAVTNITTTSGTLYDCAG